MKIDGSMVGMGLIAQVFESLGGGAKDADPQPPQPSLISFLERHANRGRHYKPWCDTENYLLVYGMDRGLEAQEVKQLFFKNLEHNDDSIKNRYRYQRVQIDFLTEATPPQFREDAKKMVDEFLADRR